MTIEIQNNLLAKLSNVSKSLIEEYRTCEDGNNDERTQSISKVKSEYRRLKDLITSATVKTPDKHFDGDVVLLQERLKQHQTKFK